MTSGRYQQLNLRVLLVEDDPANAQYARRVLCQMGCDVCLAESGEEALRLYRKDYHQIIILDIRLPKMDGIEFMQRIRSEESHSGFDPVPIEVLTADALTSRRQTCLACGANGFMSKPIRPEQIYEALKTHAVAG